MSKSISSTYPEHCMSCRMNACIANFSYAIWRKTTCIDACYLLEKRTSSRYKNMKKELDKKKNRADPASVTSRAKKTYSIWSHVLSHSTPHSRSYWNSLLQR